MDGNKKCSICGKAAVFHSPYLKQDLCKKHFEKMLLRRFRGNVASLKNRRDSVRIGRGNPLGREFLEFFFRDAGKGKYAEAKPHTLEDFAINVMRYFIFHEGSSKKIRGDGFFSPLFNISENEISSFFMLKKIKPRTKKRNGKDMYILGFLQEIEERRPGGMISLVKAGITLEII